MKKENLYSIFIYEEKEESLVEELSKYIEDNADIIYNFFNINNKKKAIINIISTKKEFDIVYNRLHYMKDDSLVPKWVVGYFAKDTNIYYLSLNDYSNTTHMNETLDSYKKTILHEFIHFVTYLFCVENDCDYPPKFISEGLATLLSNQNEGKTIPNNFDIKQILDDNSNCYDGWYLTTKGIIDNYGKETILELIKDKNKLNEFINNDNKKTL